MSTSVAPPAPRAQSRSRGIVALTLIAGLASAALSGCADSRPEPTTAAEAELPQLTAFDANVPVGRVPDLPHRIGIPGDFGVLVAVQMSNGTKQAAEDNGLDFVNAIGDGDLDQFRTQAESMFQQGLGAWWKYPPYDADDLEQRALDAGILSMSAGIDNTHLQIAGNSTLLGENQAAAAVKWIEDNLDGTAEVVLFSGSAEDPNAADWHAAVTDVLADARGVTIVADQNAGFSAQDGADAISTILQAHPGVNVVLGHSGPIAGALATFEALGRANDPTVYLSSHTTGDDLLAVIEKGDSVYRAAWAEPWPLYGYGYGVFAADWLAGKSIPRLMTLPAAGYVEISTPEAARTWRADMNDPGATWQTKRDEYLGLYGNISYDTREDYWRVGVRSPQQVLEVVE